MRKIIFLVAIGYCLSHAGFASAQSAERQNILEELKLFAKTINVIQEGYVEPTQPRDLFYGAVQGILKSLDDRYAQFIDARHYELLKISISGEYAGVGIRLEIKDAFPVIMSIMPGSAAEKASLQADDRILKIDGISMRDSQIADVSALLRGEEGAEVALTIERDVPKEIFDAILVRQTIVIAAIRDVRMIGKSLGYMRLVHFQDNVIEQVDEALAELKKNGMKALVIDLRNNDGGLMPTAVELAERFLKKGKKIVSVDSRVEVQRKDYISSGEKTMAEIPLLVLVNEASASASEIFSAAIQDNGRGKVIGMKTFGKASVQSVVPLDEHTAMKLTTARYLGPSGRVIDGHGIVPDEVVENLKPDQPQYDRQTARALELFKKYI